MKKFLLSLLVSVLFSSCAFTKEITKHIKKTDFTKGSEVSLYVVDLDKNKVIYKKNENKVLNPASILKVLTFGASYKVLGEDYNFETFLYQDSNKNIYVKLGADVLLTQKDLNSLISNIKNVEFSEIYIDDTIFDNEQYPPSWLEEDKWPNQRMISPYIIDNNYIDVGIVRSSLAKKVDIVQNDEYKIPFINELKIGEKQEVKIARLYGEDSSIINLQGTVVEDENIKLPVLKPEINFNVKLRASLDKNNISYSNKIISSKTPKDAVKIASVSHSIQDVSKLILHKSDNFASEVVFKVAASKYYDKSATLEDGIKMFNDVYKAYLAKHDSIADASGVSRENFICTKTVAKITSELFKNENYLNLLADSNVGTMKDRLLFLSGNLRVKTGTMKNLSSLCGCFKTRENTNILFVSIVQDFKLRNSLLKNYENTLLGIIYKKY